MSESTAALRITDLRLTYRARRGSPDREALRGVSLEVSAGQSVALLGPNGSGKSTLMRVVSGVTPADAGSIEVFDTGRLDLIRQQIGVVFQTNGLDPHLTVRENLRCQAALFGWSGVSAREQIDRALAELELTDRSDSLVKTLSGGLARRADLARALLSQPRLLLLDEPTSGLDPAARESFLARLEREQSTRGLTMLMSTHLIDEADRCDRVVLLHEGRVVADDSPQNLRRRLGGMLIAAPGRERPQVDEVEWRRVGGVWVAPLDEDTERRGALLSLLGERGVAFSVAPPTLADVFADLTGATLDRERSDGSGRTNRGEAAA
ncbi:MAG: ABC transporter ATP-binding protein [Phycisphaerales bacterium]